MKIELIEVENQTLIVPEILVDLWPVLPLDEFPDFCGAGEGLGQKIVPDTLWNMSARHCCFIHDITHTIFDKDKKHFHLSNLILLMNIILTVLNKKSNPLLKTARLYRAMTYFVAVESKAGFKCFMQIDDKEKTFIQKMALVGVKLDLKNRVVEGIKNAGKIN